ncbi:dynamin family protein [Nocardioides caldifontis]|uniref:dynamin family protein n=1 Tax=Nocardioides caldifontis TaxID=2588938 RepID=UPI0011E0059F|nr:dynamin family protein [Nocardioides caldifontis]
MSRRCSQCSHLNEEGAVFCANCNHFLEWASTPTPEPAARPRPEPPPKAPTPAEPRTEPPREPPREPPPQDQPSKQPVPTLLAAIDESAHVASERSRPDLSERLDQARRKVAARPVTVAVVGEFKRGKSTLINALIQTAACPVDADIVTAVPTLVKYGDQLRVTAHVQEPGKETTTSRPVAPEELEALVSERGDDRPSDVRTVEIEVPHRILRTGLRLLDTPGVGGLESVHGQVSLASLAGVDGVLFVTDASQELTAPELEFLRSALQRCPTAALVVTKTDLHRSWRRIVELDQQHLRDAGITIPVIALSSFLRLRAARDPALNEESGFAPLVTFLAREVVQGAAARAAAQAAHDVDFVATQLAREADAERVVLAEPERGPAVIERLQTATNRSRALSNDNASWQQTLADGIQDLVADIEFDLQARLRAVLRDARDIIDRTDPKSSWTETQGWLRREVATAGVANRDLLLRRAVELGESVANQFNLEAGEAVEVELDLVVRALEERELPSASAFSMPGGRLASLMVTARTTALVPMLAVALAPTGLLPVAVLTGAAVVVGAGVGGKLFRDEGRRQRAYRQTQAKAAAGKFVDEVAFEMNKETRDALRLTQRQLRDEFQARARSLQASATGALAAAEKVLTLPPEAQGRRAAQLDEEAQRLGRVRSRLATVSEAAPPRALVGAPGG